MYDFLFFPISWSIASRSCRTHCQCLQNLSASPKAKSPTCHRSSGLAHSGAWPHLDPLSRRLSVTVGLPNSVRAVTYFENRDDLMSMTSWIRFIIPDEDFSGVSLGSHNKHRTVLIISFFSLDMLTVIRINIKMYHGRRCLNGLVPWNSFVLKWNQVSFGVEAARPCTRAAHCHAGPDDYWFVSACYLVLGLFNPPSLLTCP